MKLLLKHFGLEAFFAHTRKTIDESAPWTADDEHAWHSEDMFSWQTTICYLTLPREAAAKRKYGINEMEADGGYAHIEGFSSSMVTLPDIARREVMDQQFLKALRTLDLKPYIHPSQLVDNVAPRRLGDQGQSAANASSKGARKDSGARGMCIEFAKRLLPANLRRCERDSVASAYPARPELVLVVTRASVHPSFSWSNAIREMY